MEQSGDDSLMKNVCYPKRFGLRESRNSMCVLCLKRITNRKLSFKSFFVVLRLFCIFSFFSYEFLVMFMKTHSYVHTKTLPVTKEHTLYPTTPQNQTNQCILKEQMISYGNAHTYNSSM